MTEPVLELSEHELYFLPPGTPAIAPATRVEVEGDGEVRAFLARLEWQRPDTRTHKNGYVFYVREGVENRVVLSKSISASTQQRMPSERQLKEWIYSAIKYGGQINARRLWHPLETNFGVCFTTQVAEFDYCRENNLFESASFICGAPRIRLPKLAIVRSTSSCNFANGFMRTKTRSLTLPCSGAESRQKRKTRLLLAAKQGIGILCNGSFPSLKKWWRTAVACFPCPMQEFRSGDLIRPGPPKMCRTRWRGQHVGAPLLAKSFNLRFWATNRIA